MKRKPKQKASSARKEGVSRRGTPDRSRVLDADVQSGDTQGLSRTEDVDSESVEELAAEGQDFEAGVVSGVEDAPDADVSEVRTREVLEDDVPREYDDQ